MGPKLITESNTQPIMSQHGPCVCFNIRGKENVAFCLQSLHWPKVALPWIQRCQLKQRPPECVFSDIIKKDVTMFQLVVCILVVKKKGNSEFHFPDQSKYWFIQ